MLSKFLAIRPPTYTLAIAIGQSVVIGNAPRSILNLLPRLVHMYRDRQSLAGSTETRAAHRRGTEIVEANRNPYMGVGDANSVGRIKANPAKILNIGLCPGMAGILRRDTVGAMEMASDVTRREAERSRRGNKNMCDVLTDASPERK